METVSEIQEKLNNDPELLTLNMYRLINITFKQPVVAP